MSGAPASSWGEPLSEAAEPQAILARIDRTWEAAWPVIAGLPEERLLAPASESEPWSPKELMTHLSHWNDAHRFVVGEHLDGRERDIYGDWREKNDRWAEEDRGLSIAEARERLEDSHSALRALLGTLNDEQWDGAVRAWVLQCPLRHYELHLRPLAP